MAHGVLCCFASMINGIMDTSLESHIHQYKPPKAIFLNRHALHPFKRTCSSSSTLQNDRRLYGLIIWTA